MVPSNPTLKRTISKVIVMRTRFISLWVTVLIAATASITVAQSGQGQAGAGPSPDEQSMAKAVMTAPDPGVQIKAASDFVKKYPKSTLRPRLARELAEKVSGATDPAQKVSGAQAYREIFTEPSEQEMIVPVLVEGLVAAKRTDEAFTTGGAYLAKNPESLDVLVQL